MAPAWMQHPFYGPAVTLAFLLSAIFSGYSARGNDAPTSSEFDLVEARVNALEAWKVDLEKVRRARGLSDQCIVLTIQWLDGGKAGREPRCDLTVAE